MDGAVPSTLHQFILFRYEQQKVLIWGKRGKRGLDALELIGNIEEDMVSFIQPQKPLDALSYVRWLGYKEDKGLGARLQGIVDTLELNERENTCELGYTADGQIIKNRTTTDSALSLSQIFHSTGFHND